jgi:hypothetical protein
MKGSGKCSFAAGVALLAAGLCAAPQAAAQLLGGNLAPNVNVVNTPNVSIANTPGVSVLNPASAPVPVHEVSAVSRQPVVFSLLVGMSFGTQRAACSDYTVPTGMRLEIDHVSAASSVLFQGNTIQATYSTRNGFAINEYYLDFHDQAFDPTQPLFIADHSQLAFSDPGSTVELCAVLKSTQGSGSGGFTALRATFSGYLISGP